MFHMIAGGEFGSRVDQEKGGMDIIDFEVWVKDYLDKFQHNPAEVNPSATAPHLLAVRRLTNFDRTKEWFQSFEAVVESYMNSPFNEAMNWNIMSAQIDCCQSICRPGCCWRSLDDPKGLLCSTMVADAMKKTQLLDPTMESAEYVPAMWDTTRKLALLAGAKLSKEYFTQGPVAVEERERVL